MKIVGIGCTSAAAVEAPSAADMQDTIDKLQQRVFTYSTEALVYQEGSDRINIEIPALRRHGEIDTKFTVLHIVPGGAGLRIRYIRAVKGDRAIRFQLYL